MWPVLPGTGEPLKAFEQQHATFTDSICMENELVGEGDSGTSDGAVKWSRGEVTGDRKGRPEGGRLKGRTWQAIGFVSKMEVLNPRPDLHPWTSGLSCLALSEAGL